MTGNVMEQLREAMHEGLQALHAGQPVDGEKCLSALEPYFARSGYRQPDQKTGAVRSILVLLLDAIGDTVLTSGFLRELRRANPQAYIAVLVRPILMPLVRNCPYINAMIPLAGERTMAGLQEMEAVFVEQLWPHHFDMALSKIWGADLRDYRRLLLYLSGARERVDFGDRVVEAYGARAEQSKTECLLTKSILTPAKYTHEAARIFYLFEALGWPPMDKDMELWYSGADACRAKALLAELPSGVCPIIVGIGAGGETRKYPIPKLARALQEISRRYQVAYIAVGGQTEKAAAQELASLLPGQIVLDFCGRLTLTETEAVVSEGAIYIGNDTGVMHMAAAAHKPVIELSRDPRDKDNAWSPIFSSICRFAPWRTPYIALRPERAIGHCRDVLVYGGCAEPVAHCIATIPPEAIVAAFEALMNADLLGE